MDINIENRADWERRRKIRLAQVRDQSKELAKTIRDRVHGAVETELKQQETTRNKSEHKFKSLALSKLKSDFNYLVQDVGSGFSIASVQPDPNIVLAEKRLINRCKAMSRGLEAEKRQKRVQEERHMDAEMKERQTNFNKTVEKIRSTLISTIRPSIDNNIQNNNKYNECFLIPSQVTLNESNIISWNYNKKTSKPWSMVISSKENQLAVHDDNKENEQKECKLTKLETDVKSYEKLVTELNKLSAEEQSINNKLFTHNWKEVLEPCKNNVVSSNPEKQKPKEMTEVKHILDERTRHKITEKKIDDSSTYISSSLSTSTSSDQPMKTVKKNVHFENKTNELSNIQSKSKLNSKKQLNSERPLRNINNTLQRIKMKKQLLLKEITTDTTDTRTDIQKSKVVSSTSKMSPTRKRSAAGNDLPKVSPTTYAQLPDSFYCNQLETLKKQISNEKSKSCDSKLNTSSNVDLMGYINSLLKMTPLEVDNLSISSCSTINLEESILQSKNKTEYYIEMLNCISKCLNADISDINQDKVFNSPENINLISRLQGLTNYYQEKTHEMKNICDESLQILNDKLNEENLETKSQIPSKNSSISKSSDSSVDGEYILRHLNTLLQKKGLIKPDKEWPMFESISNDDVDDNRSLTDQLLDIST